MFQMRTHRQCGKIMRLKRDFRLEEKPQKPSGKDHYAWKGDNVGYRAIHDYMTRHKPKPDRCELCDEKKPLDLACVSETYTRDPDDYRWVCRTCHHLLDGRIDNLGEYGKKKNENSTTVPEME